MDLISSGNTRSYEDFKKQIPSLVKPVFDSVREYCLSLGKNVVEDVRMHRIVFCKSMTFRFFADIEPQHDSILLKIRRDRKEPQKEIKIRYDQSLEDVKESLLDAYNTIR